MKESRSLGCVNLNRIQWNNSVSTFAVEKEWKTSKQERVYKDQHIPRGVLSEVRFVKAVTFGHAHAELFCVEHSWELQSLPQSDAPFVTGSKMLQISWKCIVCVSACVLFLFRNSRYSYPLVFQEVQTSRIFLNIRHMKVASFWALRTVRFYLPSPTGDILGTHLC
jgi:hypothetical protein